MNTQDNAPGVIVDVKGLWVVLQGEGDDALAREVIEAEVMGSADFNLFERQSHHGRRTRMKLMPVSSSLISPASLVTTQRQSRMPSSGRDFETRRETTVMVPLSERIALWERMATDLRPPHLEQSITSEVPLDEAPRVLERIVGGGVQGRTVVRISA